MSGIDAALQSTKTSLLRSQMSKNLNNFFGPPKAKIFFPESQGITVFHQNALKTLEIVVLLKSDVAKTFVFLWFLDDPTMQNGMQKTFEFVAFLNGLHR